MNEKHIYSRMFHLCLGILFTSFLLKVALNTSFDVSTTNTLILRFTQIADQHRILQLVLAFCLSSVSYMCLFFVCLGGRGFKTEHVQCVILVVLAATLVEWFFIDILLFSFLTDIVIFSLFCLLCKDIKSVASGYAFSFLVVSFLTLLKDTGFSSDISDSAVIGMLVVIDVYIVHVIYGIHLRGGSDRWEFGACSGLGKTWKLLTNWPKNAELMAGLTMRKRSNVDLQSLGLKTKMQLYSRRYGSHVAIWGSIATFSYFTQQWIEAIILIGCYGFLRYTFPTTFHTTPLRCMIISVTATCAFLNNVLPVQASLLSSVLVAFVFTAGLYQYQEYQDLKSSRILKGTKLTRKDLEDAFVRHKTLVKYRSYLMAVLVDGFRDVDFFALPECRDAYIDEQQYRNYKSKFMKRLKADGLL